MKMIKSNVVTALKYICLLFTFVLFSGCSNSMSHVTPSKNERPISSQVVDIVLHQDSNGNYRSKEELQEKDKEIEVVFTNKKKHHEIVFKLSIKRPNKPVEEIKQTNFRTFIKFIEPSIAPLNSFCKKPQRWIDGVPQNIPGKPWKKIKLKNDSKIHPNNHCYVYDLIVFTPNGQKVVIDPRIRIRR